MNNRFGSVSFPFEQDLDRLALKRTTSVNDTIKTAIKCYLLTSPGQRRGNMIGSFLSTLKHMLIPEKTLKGIQESLEKDLIAQFSGVIFEKVTLTKQIDAQDKSSDLVVTISFRTNSTDIQSLIVLIK